MQVADILSKHLSKVMHKTRLTTLSLLVDTLFHAKFLSLTSLGRALKTSAQERSAIRRVDRFFGNKGLQEDRRPIYHTICQLLVGSSQRPQIIVDWSPIPNQPSHVLRAALVTSGRALTLYEEIHPEKRYTNEKVHLSFLKKLKTMIPADAKPIIITDAGFHNSWFRAVLGLGWDYVGRIRGNKCYRLKSSTKWSRISELFEQGTSTPRFLGEILLCKDQELETKMYLYKSKKLGRQKKTKRGNILQNSQSKKHAKANKEPWILVSSLPKNSHTARKVIKIYARRMQVEEGFRDLKSTKFGFGFEHVKTNHIYRLNLFFLIAMLASFLAWMVGWLGEKKKLHAQYQANSIKSKRILSLFYLGRRIILREQQDEIKNMCIQSIIDNFPNFCEA